MQDLPLSPALRIIDRMKPTLQGRCIGILVADGSNGTTVANLRKALEKAGATVKIVAPKVGGAVLKDGTLLPADGQLQGTPSVVFDAVASILSPEMGEQLAESRGRGLVPRRLRPPQGHCRLQGHAGHLAGRWHRARCGRRGPRRCPGLHRRGANPPMGPRTQSAHPCLTHQQPVEGETMSKARYDSQQLNDLVLQMMETELGGEQVYRTALTCAVNPDLKGWEGYLQETLTHQDVVRSLCDTLGLDPDTQSPTRRVVKHIGESLVKAMQLAKQGGDPAAAQLVACECVVHAETKDHANWELLGKVAEGGHGRSGPGPESSPRSGGERRRPPPVPHQGLVPRAGHRGPGHASGAAAARRGQERGNRHRRIARRAAARHALTSMQPAGG